ncbi:hypothetical protein [Paragemmobacter aquarius]|uniref:hypothetical protein n=1 Tax=Paragemmobacter aquarius TaxID=2169400 RepID=UPI001E64B09C|nr:hypothetical protein [Gemmobacter aquarius]
MVAHPKNQGRPIRIPVIRLHGRPIPSATNRLFGRSILLREQRRTRFFGLTRIEHHGGFTPHAVLWITKGRNDAVQGHVKYHMSKKYYTLIQHHRGCVKACKTNLENRFSCRLKPLVPFPVVSL